MINEKNLDKNIIKKIKKKKFNQEKNNKKNKEEKRKEREKKENNKIQDKEEKSKEIQEKINEKEDFKIDFEKTEVKAPVLEPTKDIKTGEPEMLERILESIQIDSKNKEDKIKYFNGPKGYFKSTYSDTNYRKGDEKYFITEINKELRIQPRIIKRRPEIEIRSAHIQDKETKDFDNSIKYEIEMDRKLKIFPDFKKYKKRKVMA